MPTKKFQPGVVLVVFTVPTARKDEIISGLGLRYHIGDGKSFCSVIAVPAGSEEKFVANFSEHEEVKSASLDYGNLPC